MELRDGRFVSGLIARESANSLTLRQAGGLQEVVPRPAIKEMKASPVSLMPEGLEQVITPAQMADLIAFLNGSGPQPSCDSTPEPAAAAEGALDAVEADDGAETPSGRQLIDPDTPDATRMAIIERHPDRSAGFLRDMVSDLTPGTPEEYRRIPWIWRVTIAAGRRNEAGELRRLLDISLPQAGQPLRDWECVVIGGGLINGVSQQGVWPRDRFLEVIGQDEPLLQRWQSALELAFVMADDEKVPAGTRYDALRMTPFLPWEKARSQLARYLGKEINAELQQGAVSGLADVDHPEAARLLIDHFDGFTGGNKNFALDALLRGPERIDALLDAVSTQKIPAATLGDARKKQLLELEDTSLRNKARASLGAP